jgi:4-hydroxy-3-methylbut-2-enyl diphosphate reductase
VALAKVAEAAGCPRVLRVNSAAELPDDLTGTIGVTAGASAPEELVEAVIARLSPAGGVELVTFTAEDEYFPPPRELRDLLTAVSAAAAFTLAAPAVEGTPDRDLAASDVLAALGVESPARVVAGGERSRTL